MLLFGHILWEYKINDSLMTIMLEHFLIILCIPRCMNVKTQN